MTAAQKFAQLFNDMPVSNLIANLKTNVGHITVAGVTYPITTNDRAAPKTCYICCPTTAYIDYAIDETRNFMNNPVLRHTIIAVIRMCAPLVRASGLDHQVQLNNWLLSTNPMPALTDARPIRDTLTKDYPDRTILIRSLNDIADVQSITALRRAGFRMLPARVVYIAAALAGADLSNNMKHDRRLLRRGRYQIVGNDGFDAADYVVAERLYAQLYLEKYTPLNPQYTARYINEMHKRGLFTLMGLRDSTGRLVGVTGLFENAQTLTQPIVGYDTTLPQSDGLYRMVMMLAQTHAIEQGLFFNMSAGAATFKRLRRAVPAVEYTAVYVGHLPRTQRIVVRIIESILTRVGIPLLKRFAL
jgi:hypothetical protein